MFEIICLFSMHTTLNVRMYCICRNKSLRNPDICITCLCKGKSYGSEVDWMDSTTEEATLWGRMLISQGEWVEDVLPLRMLMMAK